MKVPITLQTNEEMKNSEYPNAKKKRYAKRKNKKKLSCLDDGDVST
jgi:hypothetical protein